MTCSTTVVIVNYNTRDLLLRSVESVLRIQQQEEISRVVVVDSDSSDRSLEGVRELFPEVETISVPNRGYGAAANAGVNAVDARYVLILNADTEVIPGSIAALRSELENDSNAAIAGPRLRHPDGTIQPSRRRFPGRLTPLFESTILHEWFPQNRWARKYHMADVPEDETQSVDWLVGAALLVRTRAFRDAGGFDPTFRMFSEEVDLCLRLNNWGKHTIFVPAAEIVHHEGASTNQDVPTRQADFDASKIELQRRLHGAHWARLLTGGLRIGYALQIVREGGKWIVGHRRELRRARLRLYRELLTKDMKLHG